MGVLEKLTTETTSSQFHEQKLKAGSMRQELHN